jgi:hypothetical protein
MWGIPIIKGLILSFGADAVRLNGGETRLPCGPHDGTFHVHGPELVEEEVVMAVLRSYSKAVPLSTCFLPVRRYLS